MGSGSPDGEGHAVKRRLLHGLAQRLASIRLASDTAVIHLEAGDAAAALERLRSLERDFARLEVLLEEFRRAAPARDDVRESR